jgi:hypothetical protein
MKEAKKALVIFFVMFTASMIITAVTRSMDPSAEPPESNISIYITRTDQVRNIEGKTVWVLEYTVDGVVQAPFFNSQEAMTKYRAYLDTIGTVYQRESQ